MYKFEKIDNDTYKLIINDKEYTFKRTIDIAKELQSIDMYTTYYLADFLADRGETLDNTKLRVEIKKGNQTIVDESNLNAVKEQARNLAYYDILNKIFKKTIGFNYLDLLKEINIDTSDSKGIEQFVTDFTQVLLNGINDNTP